MSVCNLPHCELYGDTSHSSWMVRSDSPHTVEPNPPPHLGVTMMYSISTPCVCSSLYCRPLQACCDHVKALCCCAVDGLLYVTMHCDLHEVDLRIEVFMSSNYSIKALTAALGFVFLNHFEHVLLLECAHF